MSQAEENFDAWWEEYKINKSDLQHILKESFKEVAKDAWMASDDSTNKRDIKEFMPIIMNRDEE